ncbi:MAG: pyrroloquinoline-quinone synthase PqqC [Frankiaceae bacterium]
MTASDTAPATLRKASAAPADDFEAELRRAESGYWDRHPFHRRMLSGQLPKEELRAWVANRWYYQDALPRKDASIIANCPIAQVRQQWVKRIVYHDGVDGGEGGRGSWLALAEAVGLTRAEVLDERHVVPGARFAVDAYIAFARTRPWYEGVASSLTELFAPATMAERMAAWRRHYPWIAEGGTRYFDDRIGHAAGEGGDALQIVQAHCRTQERKQAAVAAVRFKCSVLWGILDAIEHEMSR